MAFTEKNPISRPLRWGMIGGGKGSEIGYSHRAGAHRDGLFEFCAAALDIDPEQGKAFGIELGLDAERSYGDYKEMLASEAARDDGIEVVSIATPNFSHYEICKAALEANLHVICEKPLTLTLKESVELKALAEKHNRILAVMYGYSGFPMIHQAKAMVEKGDLGEIRLIHAEFAHGHHASAVEEHSPKLRWRVTAETSGPTYVLGDLATHTLFLTEFITGQSPQSLCCERRSFIPSRAPLEDNAQVMMRYKSGAVGSLWASAVNIGSIHGQKIRIVGSKMSIEWWDEHPNQLIVGEEGKPTQIWERGMGYLHEESDFNRIGGGHNEGFFESWANLYSRFAQVMAAKNEGRDIDLWYPNVDDGISGISFIEACVESSDNGAIWVDCP